MTVTHYLLALAVLALVGGTMANWHRSQFASPQDASGDFCGRKGRKSYVCDPENLLTFTQANQLDRTIERIINETRCPCSNYRCMQDRSGYHVGIAIAPGILSDAEMKKLADGEEKYLDDSKDQMKRLHLTELFAYTVLKQWELGRCQEDIIIAYDPENFSMFTVGGKTALKRLSPNIIGDITMTNRDEFSKGTYQGLHKILADYRLVLLNKFDAQPVYSYKAKMAAVVGSGAPHLIATTLSLLVVAVLSALW